MYPVLIHTVIEVGNSEYANSLTDYKIENI